MHSPDITMDTKIHLRSTRRVQNLTCTVPIPNNTLLSSFERTQSSEYGSLTKRECRGRHLSADIGKRKL